MIETVAGAIAGPIFEQLWKIGGDTVQELKGQYRRIDAVNQLLSACAQYENNYRERHGRVKVMPSLMKSSVSLESIYVTVNLLDETDVRQFWTEQDLEEAYRQSGQRNFQLRGNNQVDGITIANQEKFLMILGGPGIGKSTFLQKLGIESLKKDGQLTHNCIPIYIELRGLNNKIDLINAIAKEFGNCKFPAPKEFTLKALEEGKLLILLDGLDEVTKQDLGYISEYIENFVDRYDKNRFIISCRVAAYDSNFNRFTDVTIAEFNNEQIEQFIKQWFISELDQIEGTAENYWKLLSRDEHKATKELAQTPLFLIFLCLVYDNEQSLPKTRSNLYEIALNILLKEWAAQMRVKRDPIYEGFHPELEKLLLAEIAYESFKEDCLFFPKSEVLDKITKFLSNTLNAPKYLDGEAVLKAIEIQQGILVERAINTYSFSHLTIQEYLTARYIVENDLVEGIVIKYSSDERWHDVFLLISGLLGRRIVKLWTYLEKVSLSHLKNNEVCKLVDYTNSIYSKQNIDCSNRAMTLWVAALYITITMGVRQIENSTINKEKVSSENKKISELRSASPVAHAATNSAISRYIEIHMSLGRAIATAVKIAGSRVGSISMSSVGTSMFVITRSIVGAILKAVSIVDDSLNFIYIVKPFDVYSSVEDAIESAIEEIEIAIQLQELEDNKLKKAYQQLLIAKELIPSKESDFQKRFAWVNSLKTTWLELFSLTDEYVQFSTVDIKAFGKYLYLEDLIICCTESAIRVPKKEWKRVEARLLTSSKALSDII